MSPRINIPHPIITNIDLFEPLPQMPRARRNGFYGRLPGVNQILVAQRISSCRETYPRPIQPQPIVRRYLRDPDPHQTTIRNVHRVPVQIPPNRQIQAMRRWSITIARPDHHDPLGNRFNSSTCVKTIWVSFFFIPGALLLGTSFIPGETGSLSNGLRWSGVALIILGILPIVAMCHNED